MEEIEEEIINVDMIPKSEFVEVDDENDYEEVICYDEVPFDVDSAGFGKGQQDEKFNFQDILKGLYVKMEKEGQFVPENYEDMCFTFEEIEEPRSDSEDLEKYFSSKMEERFRREFSDGNICNLKGKSLQKANEIELDFDKGNNSLVSDVLTATEEDALVLYEQNIGKQALNELANMKIFQCKSCLAQFPAKKDCLLHPCCVWRAGKEVAVRKLYRCFRCGKMFKSRLVFEIHLDLQECSKIPVIGDESYPRVVKREYDELATAELHWMEDGSNCAQEKTKAPGQCDTCGKITENLKHHLMYHNIVDLEAWKASNKVLKQNWFYCSYCEKKIYAEINYMFHMAEHTGEARVKCKQCDFATADMVEYNIHTAHHAGVRSYVCHDCNKCFFTRSAISDHVLLHMEQTRYMCELCGKRFKTCRGHAQHKLLQHRKYFRCFKCNRGFSDQEKLRVHTEACLLNSKHGKKGAAAASAAASGTADAVSKKPKHFCDLCNVYIKGNTELAFRFHMSKHEGRNGLDCPVCGQFCKNICTYKTHILKHTDERPFACDQCPKTFRTKGCLVQHLLVHGDEYKYVCKYCGKKSKKQTTHVNHVNIHTDTRPYSCPDCNRPFRQLSDMKKHRKTHTKVKRQPSEELEVEQVTEEQEIEIEGEIILEPGIEIEQITEEDFFFEYASDIKEEIVNTGNILF